MFFIMGMSQGQKQLDYNQTVICGVCGRYGRYDVFMTYMYFSFFFIPLFKWNRRYYVQTSCCGSVYELNPEKGRMIEYGQRVTIESEDMLLQHRGTGRSEREPFYEEDRGDGKTVYETPPRLTDGTMKKCPSCGYMAASDFEYCPKCGRKL